MYEFQATNDIATKLMMTVLSRYGLFLFACLNVILGIDLKVYGYVQGHQTLKADNS